MDRVALIIVQDGRGNVLFGKRRDSGKYSLIGGHIEPGEDPKAGALRELHEEAGFQLDDITFMREHCVPGGPVLYCYSALCPGQPHNVNDPDAEFSEFKWVPVKDGLPKEIYGNLQGPPPGPDNVVTQTYDLQKAQALTPHEYMDSEPGYVYHATHKDNLPGIAAKGLVPNGPEHSRLTMRWVDGGKEPRTYFAHDADKCWGQTMWNPEARLLRVKTSEHPFGAERSNEAWPISRDTVHPSKIEVHTDAGWHPLTAPDLQKSQHALHRLVQKALGAQLQKSELNRHADPKERALALKLNTTTPHDVALAALDPDEWVAHCAIMHPHHAEHALDAIANNTHDLGGTPIWHRHDELLADPRLTPQHIDRMYAATRVAALPEHERVHRLATLAAHPRFPLTDNTLAASEAGLPVGDFSKSEWAHKLIAQSSRVPASDFSKETVPPHLQHLAEAFKAGAKEGMAPEDSDLHATGDISPKAIYKIPHAGGHHVVMVKPYSERDSNRSGWAELTSQALYHAGGMGHLHQSVFPLEHGVGQYRKPAVGIQIDPDAKPSWHREVYSPEEQEQARRISMMDHLVGNADRHGDNLMQRPGALLAIDHAGTFQSGADGGVKDPFSDRRLPYEAPAGIAPSNDPKDWAPTLAWWSQKSPAIRQAAAERIQMLHHPEERRAASDQFEARAGWFDARARESAAGQLQPDWHKL